MYEIFSRILEERGLRPSTVARATGLSNALFSDWKRGRTHPNAVNMQRIADYLHVPVSYLITGEMPDVPTSDRPILRAVLEACAGLSDQDLSVVYTVASALRGRSDVD